MPIKFQNSMKSEITPLIQLPSTTMPYVFYTVDAWKTIEYLVMKAEKEIGWFGLVDEYDDGNYCITEILIPHQEVTSASVDIETDAISKLVNQLMDAGKNPEKLRYHGHSHVNMQVIPSTTDQNHLEEYMEDCPWFIRGIYNKKGESKVDIFDRRQQCVFQCASTDILENLRDDAFYEALDATLEERVVQYKPKYLQHTGSFRQKGGRITPAHLYRHLDDFDFDDDIEDLIYREKIQDPFYAGKP